MIIFQFKFTMSCLTMLNHLLKPLLPSQLSVQDYKLCSAQQWIHSYEAFCGAVVLFSEKFMLNFSWKLKQHSSHGCMRVTQNIIVCTWYKYLKHFQAHSDLDLVGWLTGRKDGRKAGWRQQEDSWQEMTGKISSAQWFSLRAQLPWIDTNQSHHDVVKLQNTQDLNFTVRIFDSVLIVSAEIFPRWILTWILKIS